MILDPGEDESDALSDLAKARREEVARESQRPKPSILNAVEQSEVSYSFELAAMPFRQIDLQLLTPELEKAFGVSIDGPDLSPLLSVMTREQLVATEEVVLLRRLMRLPNAGTIRWTDGRFPLRDDFIPIRSIAINFESILVSVEGESEVAELVAQETMELIWRLAGSKKVFEKDLKPMVALTAYGTRTRLLLDKGPEMLLNPALFDFLDENLARGRRFAAAMGRQKTGSDAEEVQAVPALDSLTIRVNRWNPKTGYSEESNIKFDVTARSDYRTGRITVTSELPYDRHMEMCTELFELFRE